MALQFKIQLKNISNPTVWRRVVVPEHITFLDFHLVIQLSFGWFDTHLFMFSPKGWGSSPLIEIPEPEEEIFPSFGGRAEKLDAAKVKLTDIFQIEKQKYSYIYDFGDDWKHEITLEKMTDEKVLYPRCIKASGTCPPEDCGGPWGYENIKEILADKKHPEHKDTKEWLGLSPRENWNVDEVDIDFININLKDIPLS